MRMQNVVEVVQVIGATNANKRLSEGWKLLAVNAADGPDEKTMIWYVLGRTGELNPASGPNPEFNWP
ncbi:hypothetical protein D3C76_1733910 [compost metagenome]